MMPHPMMKLAKSRPKVSHKSAQSRPRVGPKSAQSPPEIGPKSAQSRPKVRPRLAQDWPKPWPKVGQSRPRSAQVQSWLTKVWVRSKNSKFGPKWVENRRFGPKQKPNESYGLSGPIRTTPEAKKGEKTLFLRKTAPGGPRFSHAMAISFLAYTLYHESAMHTRRGPN